MKKVSLTRTESAIEYSFIDRILRVNSAIFSEGQKKLAVIIGFHENAVSQALASLEDRGWICRYKEGNKNIIEFCLSERELNLRLSYCSEVVCKSITDIEFLSEFKSINEKYRQTIKQQQDQLQKDEEHEYATKKKVKLVTEPQVWDFVNNLYKTLSDVFDKRTLKEKVKGVIRKFQMRYGYDEQNELDDNNLDDYLKFKGKSVVQGFKETQKG